MYTIRLYTGIYEGTLSVLLSCHVIGGPNNQELITKYLITLLMS